MSEEEMMASEQVAPKSKKSNRSKASKQPKQKKAKTSDTKEEDAEVDAETLVGGKTPGHLIRFAILAYAKSNNLRRSGDRVLKPHASVGGVFLDYKAASDFINMVCKDMPEFHSPKVTMSSTLSWFEGHDHSYFPRWACQGMQTDAWLMVHRDRRWPLGWKRELRDCLLVAFV
jgi:hypothetical protein